MRASTSGWRASRSSAQPSEPAVVSWPAASSVASWSRSCSREAPVPLSTESSVPSSSSLVDPLVEQGVERPDAAQVGRVRAVPLRHRLIASSIGIGTWSARRIASRSRGSPPPNTTRRMISSATACMRSSVLIGRPGSQRASSVVGHAGHRLAPALELLAVEGRQHELALLQVLLAVEHEDRARAGERLQEGRAGAGAQLIGRRGVDALDLRRVGGEDHRRVRPRQPQRERLAVAGLGAAHQRGRPGDPLVGLERGRRRGTGWEHGTHLPAALY